jgi:hypothetical protein
MDAVCSWITAYFIVGKAKGFAGGVPLNTETSAVKPRVGSCYQEVFVPGRGLRAVRTSWARGSDCIPSVRVLAACEQVFVRFLK